MRPPCWRWSAGVAVLAAFGVWERRLNRRPGGQPLLDLSLFRSASFTWGVILAALAVLSMIGVLFTMPQYFQGVIGTDAMGSGLRLLPVIVGLVVGAIPPSASSGSPAPSSSPAAGFLLLALGLFIGSTTGGRLEHGVRRGLDGGRRRGPRPGAFHVDISCTRRAVGGAQRRGLRGAAGGEQGRRSVRHRDPRERAELGLPVATRPHGPAGTSRRARSSRASSPASPSRSKSGRRIAALGRSAFTVTGWTSRCVVSGGIAIVGLVLTLLFLPRSNALPENQPVQPDSERELAGTR